MTEDEKRLAAQRAQGDRNRERVDHMARLIRELKESPFPADEHALLRQLAVLDHPDIKGLVMAIEEKRKKPAPAARGAR